MAWSWEITWKTKTIISPLLHCLWPPNLAGTANLERLLLIMLLNPLKLLIKTIISPLHDAYGHQTIQDCDLPWGSSTHKNTCPFAHVLLQYHVTNWNRFIFTTTTAKATKLDRMVTYLMGKIIITWFCKIIWQTKVFVYPLPQCLWLPNGPGWVYTLLSFFP